MSGDLDLDGVEEVAVVVGSETNLGRSWKLVRIENRDFVDLWSSPDLGSEIQTLKFLDVDLDGADEVIVGTKDRILLYAGILPSLTREIAVDYQKIHDLTLVNTTRNGLGEVALCGTSATSNGFAVYDFMTGEMVLNRPNIGCTKLAVRDIDLDQADELMLLDTSRPEGRELTILSLSDYSVEWASDTSAKPDPGFAGGGRQPIPKGVTCTHNRSYTSSHSFCGSCGVTWPCLNKLVFLYYQDCWTCTDPSYNWCNDPVNYATPCEHSCCI